MTLTLEKPRLAETDVVGALQGYLKEQIDAVPVDPHESLELTLPVPGGGAPAVFDPYNERLKLYEIQAHDLSKAEGEGSQPSTELVSKITVYATGGEAEDWNALGFKPEAVIEGFFEDGADAHIWAAFPDPERELSPREQQHDEGVALAQARPRLLEPSLPEGYSCRVAGPDQAQEIAQLLDTTFRDYPTPINSDRIREQIETLSNHFRVVDSPEGVAVAVASAEIDHTRRTAEMTDCATRSDQRGRGLMAYLLWALEQDMHQTLGIRDLYTLARADEVGMNCVFSKLGYRYGGRLVNNCRMPNGWESMNVWCRRPAV